MEERIKLLESKVQWLFEGTNLANMLFENDITQEQNKKFGDVMDSIRADIEKKIEVHHYTLEEAFYRIAPQINGNYHFCESYCRYCWEDRRWEEVFVALYGDIAKFQSVLNR